MPRTTHRRNGEREHLLEEQPSDGRHHGSSTGSPSLLLLWVLLATVAGAQPQIDGDWIAYGRDPGGERYSPLTSIHRGNVGSLQVAWTYRTGDAYTPPRGRATAFEATPLHVDGTLYLSTPLGRVHA